MKAKPDIAAKVLNSYIELSFKNGILNVTLQKAAKHAKVNFASAHYHWGGKHKDITSAALKKVGENAQDYIESVIDSAIKKKTNPLQAYIRGTFDWIRDCESEAQLWLFSYYHVSHGDFSKDYAQTFIEVARTRVERLIHESVGMGFYSKPENIAETASLIYSLLMGNGVLAIMSKSPQQRNALEKLTLKELERMIGVEG